MESLTNEFAEMVGEFIDEYVALANGEKIPRNIPVIRDSFELMIKDGFFSSYDEIRKKALKEKRILIPNFLFKQ